MFFVFFFFKQKTAYEMRISDWSSDVCSSDLAYNAAKEAIRALSRTAANEWGQYGIRVNVINPVIATDSYREDVSTDEARQAFESTIPLRFIGQPIEAARVAVFLAGPDSRYLTGQTLYTDGGLVSIP